MKLNRDDSGRLVLERISLVSDSRSTVDEISRDSETKPSVERESDTAVDRLNEAPQFIVATDRIDANEATEVCRLLAKMGIAFVVRELQPG